MVVLKELVEISSNCFICCVIFFGGVHCLQTLWCFLIFKMKCMNYVLFFKPKQSLSTKTNSTVNSSTNIK